MNILFFTRGEVSPYKGGTERITHTLSNALKTNYGHKCFTAYLRADRTSVVTEFDGSLHVNRFFVSRSIAKFVKQNTIECIIVQGEFSFLRNIRSLFDKNRNCKIIFAHHFEPGFERNFFKKSDVLECIHQQKGVSKILHIVQLLFYPMLHYRYLKKLPAFYHNSYIYSDRVVLLSKRFRDGYMKFGYISDDNKFTYIPNALSYKTFATINDIRKKEKIVLIVSRLDERQKRISLALRIWKEFKKFPDSYNWNLHIVGEGKDRDWYEYIVNNELISDVHFLGKMDPASEYVKASIFMMTSVSEGWGLTLTETQQFGCIPIAFDTYQSLHDIIPDESAGCIVKEGDIKGYVDIMLRLAKDPAVRLNLSCSCIESAKRFMIDQIAAEWNNLILKHN